MTYTIYGMPITDMPYDGPLLVTTRDYTTDADMFATAISLAQLAHDDPDAMVEMADPDNVGYVTCHTVWLVTPTGDRYDIDPSHTLADYA